MGIRAVESLAKETGDHVSDHLFATLRNQFAKGTSRAKAVKITKSLFNKRQAVGRIYDYIDDATRAALYEFVEAEDVLEEEIEQLGKIAQTYQAETGKALTKTQLNDLIGDSNLGTKSVEEIVAGLREKKKCTLLKERKLFIDYQNPAGNVVRIPKQSQASIKQSIATKICSDDEGIKLEADIGNYIQNELGIDLTDFANKITNRTKQPMGDIDCATKNVLIEVKNSMGSVDIEQFRKYTDITDEKYFNIQDKKVILYVDQELKDILSKDIYKIYEIEDMGVEIVYKDSKDRFSGLKGVVK